MKLILEKDEGIQVEVRDIVNLDKDSKILFFFLNGHFREQDIINIEESLSSKTGRKCIVLDSIFKDKIMGI